jgi:hypothetical protein
MRSYQIRDTRGSGAGAPPAAAAILEEAAREVMRAAALRLRNRPEPRKRGSFGILVGHTRTSIAG